MKKLLFALALFSGMAFAQSPDCVIRFNNWTIAQTTAYQDNRSNACTNWVLTYQATGFTAISLQFESATGATSPGVFGAFSGTVVTGVNPSVSVACGAVANCTAVFSGQVGWYRLNLTSVTGSGTISGTLKGYIGFVPLGGNTSPTGGCPVATPCVVVGPTAAGAAATTAPVLQGWLDGANIQNVFFCPNQAAITITAGTDTVIVAGLVAKKTIICHLDFASNITATFTVQQGTGVTCGTGTAAITGGYPSVATFAMDYQPMAALRTTANANDICLHSGSAVTVGGFVTYVQF